jgi:phospholipid/cholesterol/gamma-HCH transport system permease protein
VHPLISLQLSGDTLYIGGSLSLDTIGEFFRYSGNLLKEYREPSLVLDLKELTLLDSGGAMAIRQFMEALEKHHISGELRDAGEAVREKLALFSAEEYSGMEQELSPGFFERIGQRTSLFWNEYLKQFLLLAADIFYWSFIGIFGKRVHRKGEVTNQAVQMGVNAVFIVATMSFIIGLVLALQSAAQLRTFGANVYIVDLTVIAMMSEMGPLIAAIMVAGRSGSAIAAEIATMKTTSETDALRMMGLPPIRFVVVPKVYGGLLTMPFLTIIADAAGILGGLLIAMAMLGITPAVFFGRMQESLLLRDIIFGIMKSFFFSYLIVLTGSFFGFRASGGAPGVGRVTTRAVVVSISLVIVADSIMGLLFY